MVEYLDVHNLQWDAAIKRRLLCDASDVAAMRRGTKTHMTHWQHLFRFTTLKELVFVMRISHSGAQRKVWHAANESSNSVEEMVRSFEAYLGAWEERFDGGEVPVIRVKNTDGVVLWG